MKSVRSVLSAIAVAIALLAGTASRAGATVITYQATDLVDIVAGEDLWMYEYVVSEFAFDVNQGFSIYFDTALYSNLQLTSSHPDWDILAIQPDPALPSRGVYDSLALLSGASLASPFALNFVWTGGPGNAPASQLFTVNLFDAAGNITFLETGDTVAPGSSSVPEPSTLLIVGLGVALASRARLKRS